MDRNELILSCKPIIINLVKKYNNGYYDEDLVSVGYVGVVKCVNRCEQEGLTDPDQIHARCYIWARNEILSCIYAQKIKSDEDSEEILDTLAVNADTSIELYDWLENNLTKKQYDMFHLLVEGYTQQEIMHKLNIKKTVYFQHLKNIREKVLDFLRTN